MIDLRSDTVTKPTKEMWEAMYHAEVGDDGYGEDPTVNALEKLAAQIAGKEAALFVTSGTLGNQIAVAVHAGRSDEVICDVNAHLYSSEGGGISAHSGAQARPLVTECGKLKPEQIEDAIRPPKLNSPRTALITVENTCNHAGGIYYTVAELAAIQKVAAKHSLPVHLDGARMFNAAAAQQIAARELCECADSVQFCLSKGLCAPVGSILAGSKEFIQKARRQRRIMGGGMRQAGVIAAAGIVALKTMIDRLHEDHENAYLLASAIANTRLHIDMHTVQTNIVMCDTSPLGLTAAEFIKGLASCGVRASEFGKYKVRMVTHHDITKADILRASQSIADMAR